MMPSPTMPTLPFAIASLHWPIDPTADATRRFHLPSSAICASAAAGLSRACLIAYRPADCGTTWKCGASAWEASPRQIGIAGIGKMGAAVAQRLMEVGHTVTVWNRSTDKLKPLVAAGAALAATPAELASKSE